MRKQAIAGLVGSVGLIGAVLATGPAGAAASGGNTGGSSDQAHACPAPRADTAACNAIQLLNPAQNWRGSHVGSGGRFPTTTTTTTAATGQPSGYGPTDLQSAYKLVSTAGSGQTVAIVDAYDDPSAASDLNQYRSKFNLPPISTSGPTFTEVNQTGQSSPLPSASASWSQEISLDLDMVSAVCPNCNILLVEANSNSYADLGAAVDEAVSLGATSVSNSYGGGESGAETGYDIHYNHPGTAITVSSGDSGYGVEYPAASPYVTAVGGTSLTAASNPRGWSEKAWSGAGSGCSAYEPKPFWQTDGGCARRTVADVSAVADPNTGVAVFDTYGGSHYGAGWMVFGGTSVASPIIASVYGLAGNADTVTAAHTNSFGVTTSGYGSSPYLNGSSSTLFDVTSGSNGRCRSYLCTAGTGYDGPTGLGTPDTAGAL